MFKRGAGCSPLLRPSLIGVRVKARNRIPKPRQGLHLLQLPRLNLGGRRRWVSELLKQVLIHEVEGPIGGPTEDGQTFIWIHVKQEQSRARIGSTDLARPFDAPAVRMLLGL